jgi:hypothetical protein
VSGGVTTQHFNHLELFPDTSSSARKILSVLLDLMVTPSSVVDVGGGVGVWSRQLMEFGISRVTCIDDPRVVIKDLVIPSQCFMPCDLSQSIPAPVPTDLVLCLEVAEHVPPEKAADLIGFLVSCAPVVLFSASIPGQPGYQHVNEQPAVYWRRLFSEQGYDQYDIIRPQIVMDRDIPYWYRQNIFVYASREGAQKLHQHTLPLLGVPDDFELVHERILEIYRRPPEPLGLGDLLHQLPSAFTKRIVEKWQRLVALGARGLR